MPAHVAAANRARFSAGATLLYATLTGLLVLAGVLLIFLQLRAAENLSIQRSVEERAESIKNAIVISTTDQIQALSRMAAHWSRHREPTAVEWRQHASDYQNQYDFYRSIAWVDQNLAVRWQTRIGDVRDLEGAPLTLSEQARRELTTAIALNRFVITKPFWLPDSEPGISFHFPMQLPDGQVALLSATMAIQDTIDSIIGPRAKRNFTLTASTGDARLYPASLPDPEEATDWRQTFSVNLDEDESGIQFELALKPAAVAELRSGLPFIVLGFGAGIALALATITWLGLRSRRQALVVNAANREMQTEIQERELAERELEFLATHDPLTGLHNRAGFQRDLEALCREAATEAPRLCVLFVDLDRFKDINDSLGHSIGDQLLQAVAERLKLVFSPDDLIGRYGGDEFIVALRDCESQEDIVDVTESVLRSFDQGFEIDGHQLFTSASIGIAFAARFGDDAATLVRNADSALNKAKKAGRNRYAVFSEDILAEIQERMGIGRDIRLALDRDEFDVAYQPIVRLSDYRMVGVEVLLRWRRDGENVAPEKFIPIAEESGSIVPLGRFVVERSLRQIRQLRKQLEHDFWVAINTSAVQFRDASFPEFLSVQMHRNRILPQHIHLEFTEKVLIENITENQEVMLALNDLGLRLTVDDFGIGYSSLAYLKHFPIQCLKIDQSFIRDVDNSSDDQAIARTICALAQNLTIETVSEGVENLAQAEAMREFGCDLAQGYLFSRPLPIDQLSKRLAQSLDFTPRTSEAKITQIGDRPKRR